MRCEHESQWSKISPSAHVAANEDESILRNGQAGEVGRVIDLAVCGILLTLD